VNPRPAGACEEPKGGPGWAIIFFNRIFQLYIYRCPSTAPAGTMFDSCIRAAERRVSLALQRRCSRRLAGGHGQA